MPALYADRVAYLSTFLFSGKAEQHFNRYCATGLSRLFVTLACLLLSSTLLSAQTVTVSPSTLSFGSQAISTTSAAKTVTLKNGGSVALTISSIATSGDYSQTNTCGTSLAAGANCSITVVFTPTILGSDDSSLTITDSASNSPQTVSLTGKGLAQATATPATLSFGNEADGTSSAAKTVTLTNNLGTALAISSIATSGDYSQTNPCGTSLAAGANCSISVMFTPTILGTDDSSLTITDGASNSPQTVSLTGKGEAQATAAPATMAFGNQADGTSSAGKTVTLTNNLGTALAISSIATSGDYSQTNTCGTSLAAGTTCSISVVFTPTILGSDDSSLTITDSASNSPQTVSLTGNGVIPVKVTPASLGFGDEAVTATSAAKTVTVSNKQPTAVTITSITTPAAYAQTNTCGTLLAAQGTCTVSVTFSPTTTGSQPGTLTVTDNASNSPQTVTLSGTGTALPTITSLSTTSGIVGTTVTITGTGFDGSQGSSTVTFNGAPATPTSWAAKSIVVTVPAAATTGSVVVTVNGGPSNGVQFTVLPNITTLSTTSGIAGAVVTINGSGFGGLQGTSSVTFNGTTAFPTSWTSTSIMVPVPSAATAGNGTVLVTVGGVSSNGTTFVIVPNITGISPNPGAVGTSVTITGTSFGSSPGLVTFNGPSATPTSWTSRSIAVLVPTGATTGNVVVTVSGVSSSGFNFAVITAAPLNISRYQHSATLLNNGTVLIAGGAICPTAGSCTYLSSAEIYDSGAGTSTSTGSMATPRVAPAVLLPSGKVLIAGGSTCDPYGNCYSLNSAEIYDPGSGTFSSAGNMQAERDGHTMTLLADGRVLIAGGESCIPGGGSGGGPSSRNLGEPFLGGAHLTYASFTPVTKPVSCTVQASAEIYDPQSGTFSLTGSLNTARYNAAATTLANGQILVVGGSGEYNPLNSAELYNPSTGSFTTTSSGLETARSSPDATLLNSGFVLVSGGSTCQTPTCPTNTAELYNPTANTFQYTTGNMNVSRVNHAVVLLTNGQVLLAGGTNGCSGPSSCTSDATTEVYDPTAGTFSLSQGLAAARSGHTGTLVSNGSVLLVGGIASGITLSSVEFYSPSSLTPSGLASIAVAPANVSIFVTGIEQFVATGTFSDGSTSALQSAAWSSSNPAAAVINNAASNSGFAFGVGLGSTTITATVGTLSGSATLTVQPPVQSGGFTTTTGQMGTSLYAQTATRLTTGQVLIAGGMSPSGVVNNAQLYTPASQTFAAANPMNVARWLHTATLLNDGTVLIAGGSDLANEETLDSAEIYNPTAGTFTLLSNTLNTARVGHTATLLDNGQVLIIGGYDPETGLIADAELFDPPTQTFIDLGNTNSPRYQHTATILQNGHVLITGGETDPTPSGAYNTAELFDPALQTFTLVSVPMTTAREGHAAVLLNSGEVLISGGNDPGTGSLNTAELYDPSSDIFTAVTGVMTTPRISHAMTQLNGGQVLVVGGISGANGATLASTETYNPTSQLFTAAGSMASVREYQTDTLLNDGTVFIAGGTDGTNIFNTAEVYMASQLNGLASIAVTPSPSIGVGAQQLFTAVGTFNNGSTENLASVLWSSSSTSIAPVSNDATNPGIAASLTQGTAIVTANAAGIAGSATLTVSAPTLVSIQLSPEGPTIPLGGTQQFTATGTYTDGSTQDLTTSANWSSSASVVATINSSGLAAGLFQGVATIQVSSGSVSATTNLNIGSAALVSVAMSPASATIAAGTTQQYLATGTYSDGSTQNITGLVAWSSLSSVATINNAGLALGMSQGSTTVSASFESISVSVPLTVGPPNLVSLSITPNFASLSIGAAQQFIATGTYTDGTTQNLTSSSSWGSSNPGVLGVSNSGLATASSIGAVTITATSGSVTGTTVLLVVSGTNQANLNTSRYRHSATTLNNGQILVAGGINCPSTGSCISLNSVELYNPTTSTFANTGAMTTARSAPSVLLNSGKVLTAGGYTCDSSGNCSSLSSAEIYDPVAGTFSSAGTMTVARSGHTMTLLPNGTVLIAGGQTCTSSTSCTALSSGEIYDPVAGTFTAASTSMSAARYGASAVLVNSGYVLIAGGTDGTNLPAVIEMYGPTGFTPWQTLYVPRFDATATLLNNGNVLIAGGSTCLPGCPTSEGEMIYPGSQVGLLLNGMSVPRFNHTATLTTNGTVVIAGGYSSCATSCTEEATTEIFDPVAGTFSAGQPVATPLAEHTATLVGNGDVLLIGGIDAGTTLAASQWYQPTSLTPPGLVSITFSPANSFLALGEATQLVATGTFSNGSTQALQGVVWNSSNPSVATVSNSVGSVGNVNAQATGATMLTASAGNLFGSTSVNVLPVVSLALTPANSTVASGTPQQFIATATLSDGSTQDVTASATWATSNNQILFFANTTTPGSPPGLALGIPPGTVTITATLGAFQASTSVTVAILPLVTPSISLVSPNSGPVGTQVTVTGRGFGSSQGINGSILLGSAVGTIVSWSNSQIVATVAPSSQSGVVQVVQSDGNSSNTVPFTVNTAAISNISPASGMAGTQVTITGSGFGFPQGSGSVWLGTSPAAVISWSDTQILATVSPIAQSGNAFVQQNGVSSNAAPFSINTTTITNVLPANGVAGNQITITGSGFGTTQGNGLVWLGTAPAAVQNWSDTQILATVASGATSGSARVLQNGVMSNAIPFAVNALQVTGVSPNSGAPGIVVTITGNGFGNSQENGIVWLGSTSGEIIAWSNTQILAAVSSNAVSGVARVQQNGVWSNGVTFTVPVQAGGGGGQPVTLSPNMLSLLVGETQTIQASNASGPVTGLTWTSSDPFAVSLSADDPPVLTALAPGHVTITAGNASADVMVYAGSSLPLGTVIWSNPGDGSGVTSIVPAVPSATGTATAAPSTSDAAPTVPSATATVDVFAMNGDCTLQAMTSSGKVAWSVNIGQLPPAYIFFSGCNEFMPDFQGGVETVTQTSYVNQFGFTLFKAQFQKLDGITGNAYPAYVQDPFESPVSLNALSGAFGPYQAEGSFSTHGFSY